MLRARVWAHGETSRVGGKDGCSRFGLWIVWGSGAKNEGYQ